MNNSDASANCKAADGKSAGCKPFPAASGTSSIRRRIAHMLGHFGCQDALDWPEAHPIDIDSLQLVELALHIEAEFDIDFRDDLIPPAATLGDFVGMVEAALRQKAVDRRLAEPATNHIHKEIL